MKLRYYSTAENDYVLRSAFPQAYLTQFEGWARDNEISGFILGNAVGYHLDVVRDFFEISKLEVKFQRLEQPD